MVLPFAAASPVLVFRDEKNFQRKKEATGQVREVRAATPKTNWFEGKGQRSEVGSFWFHFSPSVIPSVRPSVASSCGPSGDSNMHLNQEQTLSFPQLPRCCRAAPLPSATVRNKCYKRGDAGRAVPLISIQTGTAAQVGASPGAVRPYVTVKHGTEPVSQGLTQTRSPGDQTG